jgi:3-oxoacyl-[acyl-carrier protein] reductase
MRLRERVVIVTGAGRGVGRQTALRLAAAGATVVAVARTAGDLRRLEQESEARAGRIVAAPGDVRLAETATAVVGDAEERFGRVDALVCNAGIERVKPLTDVSDEDLDTTLDTNLRAVVTFCRAALPGMLRRRSGHLVAVASMAGIRGFGDDAVYCASKFGVVGLMDALDEEVRARGVRVTTICPGAIDTDLVRWVAPDDPVRRWFLRPEDVAEAVHFALSQPPRVVIGLLLLRPIAEPPYSQMLDVPTLELLDGEA